MYDLLDCTAHVSLTLVPDSIPLMAVSTLVLAIVVAPPRSDCCRCRERWSLTSSIPGRM